MGLFTFTHNLLPYHVVRMDKNKWRFYNREYQPLGPDYYMTIPKNVLAMMEKLKGSEDHFYLYSDNCVPAYGGPEMDRYLKILRRLMYLKVKGSGELDTLKREFEQHKKRPEF